MTDARMADLVRVFRVRVAPPPPGTRPPSDPTLRAVLAPLAGTSPQRLRFERGPGGKPRLAPEAGRPDLRFNVSHSGEWLVIAVATGREVGVDVQQIAAPVALDGIGRFCTPAENDLLAGGPPAERQRRLARLWAGKESLLKATGEGVTDSVRRLDMAAFVERSGMIVSRPAVGEPNPREWRVTELDFGRDYAVALTVEGADAVSVEVIDWPTAAD